LKLLRRALLNIPIITHNHTHAQVELNQISIIAINNIQINKQIKRGKKEIKEKYRRERDTVVVVVVVVNMA
jgi:hypothetical protein